MAHGAVDVRTDLWTSPQAVAWLPHSGAMTSTYADDVPSDLYAWQLIDPARLLRDAAGRTPLIAGRNLLVQTVEPATRQIVTAHAVVWKGTAPGDPFEAQADVRKAMCLLGHRAWDWDDELRRRSAVVMVVVRLGRAWLRDTDYDLYRALRYANNEFQALIGDLVVVTAHGWIIEPDGVCGRTPVALGSVTKASDLSPGR